MLLKNQKKNNIKVEITDDDKEPDVLETIMYSSNIRRIFLNSESNLELTDFSDSEFEEIN